MLMCVLNFTDGEKYKINSYCHLLFIMIRNTEYQNENFLSESSNKILYKYSTCIYLYLNYYSIPLFFQCNIYTVPLIAELFSVFNMYYFKMISKYISKK